MVNKKYAEYNGGNKKKLAVDKAIEYDDVKEFYSVSSKMFNDAILTVLDRLERRRTIFHQKVKMIVRLNSKPKMNRNIGHKQDVTIDEKYDIENIDYVVDTNSILTYQNKSVADDETVRKILAIERQVLKSMGLDTATKKNYLFYSSRYEEYIKKVNKLLVERLNIAWSYDAYKIIFNMDAAVEDRDHLLHSQKESMQLDTNVKVIEQLRKKLGKEKNVDYFAIIDNLINEVVKINRKE